MQTKLAALVLLLALGVPAVASAVVTLDPALERRLREEGVYERVVGPMQAAREQGRFELEAAELDGDGLRKRAGSWHALVILVDFSDQPASGLYGPAEWESLLFSQDTHPDGSMADYYRENSYGDFVITGDVVGWHRMPQPLSWYCNADGVAGTSDDYGWGVYPNNAARLYEDALAAADPGVDFSAYLNGQSTVKGVFVVHSGPGAESTGDPGDIWSHQSERLVTTQDGVVVSSYTFQPERLGGGMSTMGVFGHEFGHVLGLPDLYDIDGSSAGLGRWSMMASGSWNGSGRTPAHFDAWCKRRLGFLTPTALPEDVDDLLVPSASLQAASFSVKSEAHGAGEYLLLELRTRDGFDALLPGEGLLAWHVDASRSSNATESCGPGFDHPIVRLIQADGLCELEQDLDGGDGGDPYPGSTGNSRLGSTTDPDTRAYSGEKTGILLENIAWEGGAIRLDLRHGETVQARVPQEYPDLASALAVVGHGDEIRLAAAHSESGDWDLHHGIRLSGGWDGAYAVQDTTLPTLLSGSGLNTILRVRDVGVPVELDNLLLRGGRGDRVYLPDEAWRGGGIRAESCSLLVSRTFFEDDTAGPDDGRPSAGGALATKDAFVRLSDVTITGARADEGGALYVDGGRLEMRRVRIDGGSLFEPAVGGSQRGGQILAEGAELSLEDCALLAGSGASHGGALHAVGGSVEIRGCRVEGAVADLAGGAFYLDGASFVLESNELRNNQSLGSGGAAQLVASVGSWWGGEVAGNTAATLGGGLQLEGLLPGSTLEAVLLRGNQAGIAGGAGMLSGGALSMSQLSLVENTAGAAAGALQVSGASASLRGSLLVGNLPHAVGWVGTPPEALDFNLYWQNGTGDPVVGAVPGLSALMADPRFVDLAGGDLHLGSGSPAIDAGDPLGATDFDGSRADLGCYGGAHDVGDRPAAVLEPRALPQGDDVLLRWQYAAAGEPAVELDVFGLDESVSKSAPGILLQVVPAPTTSWLHVAPPQSLLYRLQPVDARGRAGGYALAALPDPTAIPLREAFAVGPPIPNPFNPSTRIQLTLGRRGAVSAVLYDLAGRRVHTLQSGVLPSGTHELRWDGRDARGEVVASGVYLLRVRSEEGDATRRLLLLK